MEIKMYKKKRRKTQHPGEKPSGGGTFKEISPRGGKVNNAKKVTVKPRKSKMPPTQKPNRKWKPV